MNKRVDVLAVLDDLLALYVANPGTDAQFISCVTPNVHGSDKALRADPVGGKWLGARDARAAISELIEAATEAFDAPDVMWTIASHSEKLAERLESALIDVQGPQA